MSAARQRVPKKLMKSLIKEEVAIMIHTVLRGIPYKYTEEAKKAYNCAECGTKFHKRVWFQLYCSRGCGSRRNSRINYRWRKALR